MNVKDMGYLQNRDDTKNYNDFHAQPSVATYPKQGTLHNREPRPLTLQPPRTDR
jgi:hypothetical protein